MLHESTSSLCLPMRDRDAQWNHTSCPWSTSCRRKRRMPMFQNRVDSRPGRCGSIGLIWGIDPLKSKRIFKSPPKSLLPSPNEPTLKQTLAKEIEAKTRSYRQYCRRRLQTSAFEVHGIKSPLGTGPSLVKLF